MRHWTTEERLSQAELIRNWQPWKQSTGAKTPEGKVISSRNAFKHGLSKLQKEMRELLRKHKHLFEEISQ